MKRSLRWFDYITINIYWFGLTTLSQTNGLVFPLLVQRFVGEDTQATFFGTLRLWSLMLALLAQALMGMLSDRSTSRWGRRRPFIFIGTLANLVLVAAVGFSAGLAGMVGFWALFAIALMQQVASNTAHGAEQGLIPDLVPEEKRGRFSGVKAVLEIPLPMILVSFTIGKIISASDQLGGFETAIWGGLLVAMGVLLFSMLITMFVPEKPLKEKPSKLEWTPFLRLLLMTGLFTTIILGMGQISKIAGHLLTGIESMGTLLITMGAVGLLAMATTVALGVWFSVRISIGEAASRNQSFTWWIVNRLAFLVGTTNLSGFAVYFIQGRLGYVEEKAAGPAAQLMMVVGVFILLSALPSGWLADRFGPKRLVAISGGMAVLGTLIIILTTNMSMIYVGGCLIGIATGVFFTANWALGTELVPKHEAGRYLGISNLAGAGAGAVGAYIGGPIADFFTVHVPEVPGLGYVVLFGIYGMMFLLSVISLRGVKKEGA
ncbi:MAG: MFS transporter [Anaerolineales bacterium]